MSKKLMSLLLTLSLIFAIGTVGVSAQSSAAAPALLRIAHLALDVDPIDVVIDGEVKLENLNFFTISDHLKLEPGRHTIGLVPTGSGTRNSLVDPVVLQANSGFSYIIAVVGQNSSENLTAVLIDETTTFKDARLDPTLEQTIIMNGVSGLPDVDFYIEGKPILSGLQFGKYGAINFPTASVSAQFVTRGKFESKVLLDMSPTYGLSNNTSLVVLLGIPPDRFTVFITNYSPLNLVDYLKGYKNHQAVTFNIIAKALDTAGLSDSLAHEGPFTMFVPSDDVFKNMTPGQLDSLLKDRITLARTLRYHIVPEHLTITDIIARADRNGVTTLKTLQGAELNIMISQQGNQTLISINNQLSITSFDYLTSNGVVHVVDGLLDLPASAGNSAFQPGTVFGF